jgi:TonB family protein
MVRVKFLSLVVAASMAVAAASADPGKQVANGEQDVVSAATLKRTHTINPTWPGSAAAGVEGWVRLRFTVLPDGSVSDVVVEEAEPASVFDSSAVDALRQWKFEPVERDGKKIAQRAEIRMKFAQPR